MCVCVCVRVCLCVCAGVGTVAHEFIFFSDSPDFLVLGKTGDGITIIIVSVYRLAMNTFLQTAHSTFVLFFSFRRFPNHTVFLFF